MRKLLLLVWLIPCCVQLLSGGTNAPESIVRVAILEKVSSFNLGAEKDYLAVDLESGQKKEISSQSIFLVQPDSDGIAIGSDHFRCPVRLMPKNDGEFLRVNGRRYRDTITIRKNSRNLLTVINELGLDGYLYGILPREVGQDWPMESLKAQAVVSRTFALANLHRHDSEGFNLCSKVHCQVYGGLDAEAQSCNQAVQETHNEVIQYHGDLANALFFANCGGYTESPSNAWDTDFSPPYLKPVRCKYCKNETHYRWETQLSQEEISNALSKNGFKIVLPIRAIEIAGTSRSGRAKFLRIKHAEGKWTLRASHFRMYLGTERIRSTLFSQIRKTRNGFYFKGRGWGHGVGMCQEGAKVMARKETGYKKIIKFYYPGTKLEKLED